MDIVWHKGQVPRRMELAEYRGEAGGRSDRINE